MGRTKKERLKTFLLIFLIGTSLIQLGIHWFQQAQGFPFNFITQVFASFKSPEQMDMRSHKSAYFVPESIVIKSPTLFKLNQGDSDFKSIWQDIQQNYLPAIIKSRPTKTLPADQWNTIINEWCIRINFSVNWPNDAVFWLENTYTNDFRYFNSIKSIVIQPDKNINQTVNTIFIYDENQVYQYEINIKDDFLPKEYYMGLADKLSRQGEPKLDVLTERYSTFKSENEILVSLTNDFNFSFPSVAIEIPEAVRLDRQNIEMVQKSILLNQRDSFAPRYNAETGEAAFTDTENLYKYNRNGVLEYKYLPATNAPAAKLSSVLNHVLTFIELRKELIGDACLLMTYIEKSSNYYEMRFDYFYNGVPVYFTDVNGRITSPLIIKANEERVLECTWVIRSIREALKPQKYNLYFTNLTEKQITGSYLEILKRDVLFFERIEPGYVFGLNDTADLPVSPQWVISTGVNDYYIPLLSEEG